MSDTRDDAEQDLVAAGMASGMEDSLGSSLSSSFSMPPPAPRSRDPPSAAANPTIEANIEPTAESSERIEGMDEWKSTYEGYLSQWRADSAEARKKAVEARKRIEDEREVERRAALDESTVQRKAREAEEREKERKERLRRELEDRTTVEKGGGAGERGDERVKEAWEMMKGGSEDSERKEVVTDARGVMDHDVAAGQASISNKGRPSVKQTGYDPTTSTDPLPPSLRDPKPPTPQPMPSESETLSRQSATSQAWVEVSGSPSSAEDLSPPGSGSGFSGEEMMSASRSGSQVGIAKAGPVSREPKSGPSRGNQRSNVPVPRPEQRDSGSHQTPPAQPPSLTLSLFTMPSHLSFFRVVAVMGINLVLPFVNGVMLGFGEIFAREVVKVGKIWWKEGGSLLRSTERRSSSEAHDMDRSFAGGRGIAGVGLSGSGGFP